MPDQPELYSGISGGRVLDVGTGRGRFVEELVAELRDYEEVIGIDVDASMADEFASGAGRHPRVRFEPMDAMAMSFEDASFDTVTIAGSLHHLADPKAGLSEMLRVLRPGGRLIVVEMYRDGQTETQQTHVRLHHWWAAVDRLGGTVHRETYTRDEVVDLIAGLGLRGLMVQDYAYPHEDPHDADQAARLETSIDEYLEKASGHPDLVRDGEEIRERLHTVGFHSATLLVAMGEKPGNSIASPRS